MSTPTLTPPARVTLRRELGRWDLTAIGVNQVIGGALFAQPSLYAASVGAWSPWLVAATGFASLLIALSFAEVSSRFDATGGPYLYMRAAFGRFAAFEMGWMLWFTRAASWAAVINVLATSLAFYAPVLGSGWARRRIHHARHRHAGSNQYPGYPAEQSRPQHADHRQARAAGGVCRNWHLLHRSCPVVASGCPDDGGTVRDRASVDLRVRRLRSRSGARRRSPRSPPRRAFRPRDDDRDRDSADDVGSGGRPRDFSRPRGVEDPARRRVPALHGRVRSHSPHDWRRLLDDRQQYGAGALRFAQPLRARRAGGLAARRLPGSIRDFARR